LLACEVFDVVDALLEVGVFGGDGELRESRKDHLKRK